MNFQILPVLIIAVIEISIVQSTPWVNLTEVAVSPEVRGCLDTCLGEKSDSCYLKIQCPHVCPGELVWDENNHECIYSVSPDPMYSPKVVKKRSVGELTKSCVGQCVGLNSMDGCQISIQCQPSCAGDLEMDEDSCSCHSGDPAAEHGNLAYKRPTWQSSTYTSNHLTVTRIAALAVDGNTDGDSQHESCTHTRYLLNSWWIVDLGDNYNVSVVEIYKRTDGAPGSEVVTRLRNFYVGVYVAAPPQDPQPGEYPICHKYEGIVQESPVTITCDEPMNGRYVIIQFDNHVRNLELCEVHVH